MEILIIILFSLYWSLGYKIIDILLEKNRKYLTFYLPKYNSIYKISKQSLKFKEKLPSFSKFDKKKIASKKIDYLKAYSVELNKAFLIHTLGILLIIPLYYIVSWPIVLFNLILCFGLNLPFILTIYYNKIRIQKIIIKEKNEN